MVLWKWLSKQGVVASRKQAGLCQHIIRGSDTHPLIFQMPTRVYAQVVQAWGYVQQIPSTFFLDAKVLYLDFDREGKTFSSGCVRVSVWIELVWALKCFVLSGKSADQEIWINQTCKLKQGRFSYTEERSIKVASLAAGASWVAQSGKGAGFLSLLVPPFLCILLFFFSDLSVPGKEDEGNKHESKEVPFSYEPLIFITFGISKVTL